MYIHSLAFARLFACCSDYICSFAYHLVQPHSRSLLPVLITFSTPNARHGTARPRFSFSIHLCNASRSVSEGNPVLTASSSGFTFGPYNRYLKLTIFFLYERSPTFNLRFARSSSPLGILTLTSCCGMFDSLFSRAVSCAGILNLRRTGCRFLHPFSN